jgi:LmbE family N-acetylglucosaminyl deacetylase
MQRWIYFALAICLLMPPTINAQAPKRWTSSDIHDAIKKLNVLGSVLYVAAHPDDENTRMIAYMANERRMNTAYLSLTRGDGGQNLIGKEIQELLGVIRTQELLAARGVDGGQQIFSRANDFGYSKTATETLKIWEEDEVMADVVWAIRKFKPDVIINRFSHDSNRETHGHHTASAILSHRVFDMVGDPKVFPEQLKYVGTWQPTRLFFNTSWWFYGSRENFNKADKKGMLSVDVGVYYPLKGKSNNEIAAESRSMHRCQGFGSTGERGSQQEYLQFLKGQPATTDVFEGINTTWTRVKGGASVGELMRKIDKEFQHDNPAASIPDLVKAYKMIQKLSDEHWKAIKSKEIRSIIEGSLGLYFEVVAKDYSATIGQNVELDIEVINRLGKDVVLKEIVLPAKTLTPAEKLITNQKFKYSETINISKEMGYSNAYWLNEESSLGMYTVEDQLMRGLPETPKKTFALFKFEVGGVEIVYQKDIVYKKTDPVKGEVYRPFEVTPPVFANIIEDVYVFAADVAKPLKVRVKAGVDNLKGILSLDLPQGWQATPAEIEVDFSKKEEEKVFQFEITPPSTQSVGQVKAKVKVGDVVYEDELILIEYDHIPTQMVLRPSTAKIVRIDLVKKGNKVGYVMGAGDLIPASLEQIGYDVMLLEDGDINAENLKQYDAVIIGIRAYNTRDRLKFSHRELLKYVEEGGTMIVQYNTTGELKIDDTEIGPYPLELSRDRVAVEDAEVRFLKPEHAVLNFPNKITDQDFDGWVQERGLYFPSKWDDKYAAILSCNDPDEKPKDGGLLVAKHGKGFYIYSGYSWFRELPAGVPGAYRLFTNMISIGQFDAP